MASNNVLKNTLAGFQSSLNMLPQEDVDRFSSCQSSKDLLEQFLSMKVVVEAKRRQRQYIGSIERLIGRLTPFFAAMDVISQCDPIHAASVWGGIRIILQLASNFSTFFEKLLGYLDRIAEAFLLYDRAEKLISNPQANFVTSLQRLYSDLFKFLRDVLHVFYRADGVPKSTMRLIASAARKPFDERFKDVITDMEFHKNQLNQELILLQVQELRDVRETLEAEALEASGERKRASTGRDRSIRNEQAADEANRNLEQQREAASFDRIRAWIAPPSFARRYEDARNSREEDTGDWIFEVEAYKRWYQLPEDWDTLERSFSSNVLWIHGNPGCGKSVLATSILDNLTSTSSSNSVTYRGPSPTVCYHFFESCIQDMETSTAACRAILAQLLQRYRTDTTFQDPFSFCMTESIHGQMIASQSELADLLVLVCRSLEDAIFVIDGVDECVDPAVLTSLIQRITKNLPVRIIILSRPTVNSLLNKIPEFRRIPFQKRNVSDIRTYLSKTLAGLVQDDMLPETFDPDFHDEPLSQRADGMFLWARLLIAYLKSPALSPGDREDVIAEACLLDGLDSMYEKIFELICKGGPASPRLARFVFTWLLHSKQRVTVAELHEAYIRAKKSSEITEHARRKAFPDFEKSVILTCGGLVESEQIRECASISRNRYFRLIHASAKEYFLLCGSKQAHGHKIKEAALALTSPHSQVHLEMTNICLAYLLYDTPAQPLSGKIGGQLSKDELDQSFPLCSYAARNWPYHLQSSYGSKLILSQQKNEYDLLFIAVDRFLNGKFNVMAWIEACYVNSFPPPTGELRKWAAAVQETGFHGFALKPEMTSILANVPDFCQDLDKLQEQWGENLQQRPGCIWEEVTAFSPSRFLAQTNALKVEVVNTPTDKTNLREIANISRVALGGQYIIILKVWPSREFQDLYDQREVPSSFLQLSQYSSGWIARCEVCFAATHSLVGVLQISLEPKEVWLQLWHTLWCSDWKKQWYLQFPTSISPDGNYFSILRTIYPVNYSRSAVPSDYISMKLPLDEIGETRENHWVDPSEIPQRIGQPAYSDCSNISSRLDRPEFFNTYFYWIFFDHQSQHVCFIDEAFHEPNKIFVYLIRRFEDLNVAPIITLVGHTKKQLRSVQNAALRLFDHNQDVRQFQMAFHPTLPLIAFAVSRSLLLWNFTSGDASIRQIARLKATADGLSFSGRGEYLIVTSKILPEVIDISPYTTALGSSLTGEGPSEEHSDEVRHVDIAPNRKEKRAVAGGVKDDERVPTYLDTMPNTQSSTNGVIIPSAFSMLSLETSNQALFHGPHLHLTSDGKQTVFQPANIGTSIVIGHSDPALTSGDVGSQFFRLSSLPKVPGIESLRPEIIRPASSTSPVTVVLNTTAKSWSSLSEPSNHPDTLRIDIDQRYLWRSKTPLPTENKDRSNVLLKSPPN